MMSGDNMDFRKVSDSLDQGISTTMLDRMKIFQEYVFEGRSRTSYRARWVTKFGMICWHSCENIMNSFLPSAKKQ